MLLNFYNKTLFLLLCTICLLSCNNNKNSGNKSDSSLTNSRTQTTNEDSSHYVTRYTVCLEEGTSYDSLEFIAKKINKEANVPYDKMGQVYDKKLGLIDEKDSIYFPRYRNNEKEFLSIEMAYVFEADNELINTENRLMRIICLISPDELKARLSMEKFRKLGYPHVKYFACKLSTIDPH